MPNFAEVTAKAHALAESLRAEGYDDMDVLASIESETDLLRVFDRVAEKVDQDNRSAVIAAERGRRLKARAVKNAEFLDYLMRTMGIEEKIERPCVTVYYQNNPPKLETNGGPPGEAWMTSVPDSERIKKAILAGETVENYWVSQGRTLRVKSS